MLYFSNTHIYAIVISSKQIYHIFQKQSAFIKYTLLRRLNPMHLFIINSAIIFAFYVIGAYSTTDIIRLTVKAPAMISDNQCYCPDCGRAIKLSEQIPIISYILSCGKCRGCGAAIPAADIFLEVFFLITLSLTAMISNFSVRGYFACIIIYEFTKAAFIMKYGACADSFGRRLCSSLLHNIVVFGLLGILFFLRFVVLT